MYLIKAKFKRLISKSIIHLGKNKFISFKPNNNSRITFIMGMFRSGTSLTAEILMKLGFNLTSSWRLLKGKGSLKHLNPNGFYEDFLYAQLSRYWYFILDKTGETPPSIEIVDNFILKEINIADFIAFSEFKGYDDRINYCYRHYAYLLLIFRKERAFFFKKDNFIKIPMLTPFYMQLNEWQPRSRFLIIIRNPESTIKSSMNLTKKSDINLFNTYYAHLVNLYFLFIDKTSIFSYDNLIDYPKFSINKLRKIYGSKVQLDHNRIIDDKLIRNKREGIISNEYYERLYKEAINQIPNNRV